MKIIFLSFVLFAFFAFKQSTAKATKCAKFKGTFLFQSLAAFMYAGY